MTTQQMRRLRDQGYSYQKIADQAGVSRQHVYARINYYGTEEYNAKQRARRKRREQHEN